MKICVLRIEVLYDLSGADGRNNRPNFWWGYAVFNVPITSVTGNGLSPGCTLNKDGLNSTSSSVSNVMMLPVTPRITMNRPATSAVYRWRLNISFRIEGGLRIPITSWTGSKGRSIDLGAGSTTIQTLSSQTQSTYRKQPYTRVSATLCGSRVF